MQDLENDEVNRMAGKMQHHHNVSALYRWTDRYLAVSMHYLHIAAGKCPSIGLYERPAAAKFYQL